MKSSKNNKELEKKSPDLRSMIIKNDCLSKIIKKNIKEEQNKKVKNIFLKSKKK